MPLPNYCKDRTIDRGITAIEIGAACLQNNSNNNSSNSKQQTATVTNDTIKIDPNHGEKTPGCKSHRTHCGGGAAPSPRAPHPFFFKINPTLPLLGSRRRRRPPQPQQPQPPSQAQPQPQPAPEPPQPQQLLYKR